MTNRCAAVWPREHAEYAIGFLAGTPQGINCRLLSNRSSEMSESLSSWLALREPADIAARSASLAYAAARMLPTARPLRIVDLGTGTGSNVRYLSTRLPSPQNWLAVDGDAALLAALASQTNVDGAIQTRCINLGPTAPEDIFGGRHLVTASALLDLVSDSWIASLVDRCPANGAV